jgi:hypothetical protein
VRRKPRNGRSDYQPGRFPPSRQARMARKFVLGGGILLLIAAAVVARSAFFMIGSRAARGTVIEFVRVDTDRHAFRVRYEVGGRGHTVLTSAYPGGLSRQSNEFRIGQSLPIRYRPESPAEGRVFAAREQLGPALLFAVPGLGLLLYGLFPQRATAGPLAKRKRT